jgi:hypothetical protein
MRDNSLAACYAPAVDVERTIQSILKTQIRTEASIGALRKLVHQGMRMLVKTDTKLAELATSQKKLADVQRELAASQRELATAQKATDRTLRAFIESLRIGRNGH